MEYGEKWKNIINLKKWIKVENIVILKKWKMENFVESFKK